MIESSSVSNQLNTRNYLADYKLLSSVNDIFTSFDEYQKIKGDLNFDISILENDVYRSLSNSDADKIEEIKLRLTIWRQVLEKFDAETPVGKLRHYFEDVGFTTLLMLEHLLVFYLTKPNKSVEERDKVDLVVTRLAKMLFQTTKNENFLSPSLDLRNHLENIFTSLNLQISSVSEFQEDIKLIGTERKNLAGIISLREMLEKKVLLNLRRIKNDLGDKFFQPAILTEIVALNTSLHSTFQDLFLAEQSRLASFLQSKETSEIQVVTTAEQALATVIERPHQAQTPTLLAETGEKPNGNVSINKEEIMEIINGMRSVLVMLDQHLQLLTEKLEP